jgi:hypothetical protein
MKTLAELQEELATAREVCDAAKYDLLEAEIRVINLREVVNVSAALFSAAQEAVDNFTEPDMTREELVAALAAAESELASQEAELIAAETLLESYRQQYSEAAANAEVAKSEWDRLYELGNIAFEQISAQKIVVLGEQNDVATAKQTVDAAQAALDAFDYIEPPPPSDGVYPLEINGEPWTFRTPSPAGLSIKTSHPRLLLPGREDEIRAKLTDPAYDFEHRLFRDQPVYWALQYAINGDVAKGEAAKDWLLSQPTTAPKYGDGILPMVLVYDWCHDLFDDEDREQAIEICFAAVYMQPPSPGSVEWIVTGPRATEKGDGFTEWYGNDVHEPRSHGKGIQLRGLIALAFAHDGVRDAWCQYFFQRMLDGRDGRVYPIHDKTRGGLLDLHNSMALDSGGSQAGDHGQIITGYTAMFFDTAWQLMACWESATGDDLFSRDNAYRRMPSWLAYACQPGVMPGDGEALWALSGLYRQIDPAEAGLAEWLSRKYYSGRKDFIAFVVDDRSVKPLSPSEAGLPLSAFRAGDDRCYSQSGWNDSDTHVVLTTRTLDTHRYEPAAGLLSISGGGEKLLVGGQAKKGSMNVVYGSGIWLWPTGTSPTHSQQSSTYWGGFHLPPGEKVPRATEPLAVATHPGYRGVLPTENHGDEDYHVFAIDAARFACDGLKSPLDVKKNKRTVVHLKPIDEREFIVVYDRVVVGEGVSHLWGCRFMNRPEVNGNSFRADSGTKTMHGTFLSDISLEIRGGPGKATEGPNGESYDGTGYTFKDDDSGRDTFGSYALFAKPPGGATDYCVVLEIGDAGFVPVNPSIIDSKLTVGGWSVDFTVEDQTKVSR